MLVPLFPINIYHINLDLDKNIENDISSNLESIFSNLGNSGHHALEKDGGISTHAVIRDLFNIPVYEKFLNNVYDHLLIYWNNIGYSPFSKPIISSMWANLHPTNAWSDWHSHSTHHLAATFYLKLPKKSGNLIFYNPLEYHYHSSPFTETAKDSIMWQEIELAEHDLIIFPAWIRHKTGVNKSDKNRIVITFNIDSIPL